MLNFIKNFRNDESGAVTVDWVVLTAAIVGLGVAAISSVSGGVNALGGEVEKSLKGTATTNTNVKAGTTTTGG